MQGWAVLLKEDQRSSYYRARTKYQVAKAIPNKLAIIDGTQPV